MDQFLQILAGSVILSVLHIIIPNHWLPLITISNTEKWSSYETLWITAITGAAHTLSTIVIGLIIGLIGYKISSAHQQIMALAAPAILLIIGIVYFIIGTREHTHSPFSNIDTISQKKSKGNIILMLSLAMFLSPCLEIEAYFFTAGQLGWAGIATVAIVYFTLTIVGMIILVYLGKKGMEKVEWKGLQRHEHKITGLVLILLGVANYILYIY